MESEDKIEESRVDIALADNALAKLCALRSILDRLEECEKCTLKYDLPVLLRDIEAEFMMAGLEPNDNPAVLVLNYHREKKEAREG